MMPAAHNNAALTKILANFEGSHNLFKMSGIQWISGVADKVHSNLVSNKKNQLLWPSKLRF